MAMNIFSIKHFQYAFCGLCVDVIDKKKMDLFELYKPKLQQTHPEYNEETLFHIFSSKFLTELDDLVFFEHFTAISARPQTRVLVGMSPGERFNVLASTIRANRRNTIQN